MTINNDNTAAVGATGLMVINDAIASAGQKCTAGTISLADDPNATLALVNLNNGANGPRLDFLKNPTMMGGSAGPDDNVGLLTFSGYDDGGNLLQYAGITVKSADVSNAAENGTVAFNATIAGTDTEVARMNPISGSTYGGGFGSKVPVFLSTTSTTLTAAQSNSVFLIDATGTVITLPATVKGVTYTFVKIGTAGHTFKISPNSSDKIMGSIIDVANGNVVTAASSGAGGDNLDLELDSGSQIGDRVTIVGDGSLGWYITEALGSFVFETA